jgi:conjugal transfer pilus assembly protein TraE
MNFKTYAKTWEGTQHENSWNRRFIAGLIIVVLILTFMLFSKSTIVTIQPFTLNDEAWVTDNDSSSNYKEAWGFALAQLLGNVTPSNVNFIRARIEHMLSPAIYNDVIRILEVQAQQIKNDRVTIRFEPRFVEYEPKSRRTFVYGYSFSKGMSSAPEKRIERTYEFDIAVSNYIPVIDFIDTYQGRPKTIDVLERLQATEEMLKKNGQ